jgi:hypothetical protein
MLIMNKVKRYITTHERIIWYVNIYEINRAYGGHEEGGWYYDTGDLLKTKEFCWLDTMNEETGEYEYNQYDLALEYADKMKEKLTQAEQLDYKMGYGPHDGVDPNGDGNDDYILKGGKWGTGEYKIEVDVIEGKSYPQEAPTWY